jgi:hypothetical protein
LSHSLSGSGDPDEPRVTLPQPGDRLRFAADELMQPFIAEHCGHLLGVLDPQRHQAETFRDDRGALVEWANRPASVDQRPPAPTSTTAIVQGLSPLFRQACLVPF